MEHTDDRIVRGVVKWFDLAKGFGFVIAEGVSQDVLLHVNVVRKSGRPSVAAGDHVTLMLGSSPKGYQALELVDVSPVDEGAVATGAIHVDPQAELLPARLKWFDKAKGYGFLNVFGTQEDVFVHVDVLRAAGLLDAQVGEAMCAVLTHGAKGAAALSVHPWDAAESWSATKAKAEDAPEARRVASAREGD
ncbi:MAG: cold shock domain-containing protein [Pseudomonadota bacterium]